jgi:protein O-mannosyl-transferase
MSKRKLPTSSTALLQHTVAARHSTARAASGDWRTVLLGLGIFLAVFLVFWPALRNGFVDWDDTDNFLRNQNFRGLDPARLGWMFTTSHMGHYQPLSWITLGCDYLWGRAAFGNGMDPRSYHLTNNLLHAANAVLVYLLALRLLGMAVARTAQRQTWVVHGAAVLAALLFALHPLRVESVAWLTERRDVQSSFFILLAVLTYLRAQRSTGSQYTRWLILAIVLHACSLLSRAMAVTLPVILLVLDWYPLGRLNRDRARTRDHPLLLVLLEKVPFALLALIASITAVWAQVATSAAVAIERHPAGARLAQLCYGLVFYVRKTLLPLDLSPIYEMHVPINVGAPRYLIAIGLVVAAVAALGVLIALRRGRAFVATAACYAILILPVSGLVQSGNQEVADRYSYIPSIVLMLLLTAGVLKLWDARDVPSAVRLGIVGTTAVVLLTLATLTWRQCGVWYGTATLWTHAVAISPDSSTAQNGYGWVLLDQKRYDEALVHLRRSLEIEPGNEKAHHNIWTVLEAQGRTEERIQAYRDAIRVLPTPAEAHYNLGLELGRRGDLVGAEEEYRAALALRPNYSQAHTNLANILAKREPPTEARYHYEAAIAADPRNMIARRGLASLLKAQHRDAEAIEQLQAALAVDPNDARTRQLLESWTAPAGTPAPSPETPPK